MRKRIVIREKCCLQFIQAAFFFWLITITFRTIRQTEVKPMKNDEELRKQVKLLKVFQNIPYHEIA